MDLARRLTQDLALLCSREVQDAMTDPRVMQAIQEIHQLAQGTLRSSNDCMWLRKKTDELRALLPDFTRDAKVAWQKWMSSYGISNSQLDQRLLQCSRSVPR
jgi:hypothetical protein